MFHRWKNDLYVSLLLLYSSIATVKYCRHLLRLFAVVLVLFFSLTNKISIPYKFNLFYCFSSLQLSPIICLTVLDDKRYNLYIQIDSHTAMKEGEIQTSDVHLCGSEPWEPQYWYKQCCYWYSHIIRYLCNPRVELMGFWNTFLPEAVCINTAPGGFVSRQSPCWGETSPEMPTAACITGTTLQTSPREVQ